MRIGIAKPDYGITGGFELVMQRIEAELTRRGHDVDWLLVDVARVPRNPFGVEVTDRVWSAQPEFFRYLALVDAFAHLDASGHDLLLTTQPPSFAAEHPHHLALFSHHLRIYYDLSEAYVAAGLAADIGLHQAAQRNVREVDDHYLARPGWVLAASEFVQERLRSFNGLLNVGVYHAGVGVPEGAAQPQDDRPGLAPLCVSRHEFPKRTELFVHALKLLPDLEGDMVGGGGRLEFVRNLDARLSQPGADLDHLAASDLWLCRHDAYEPAPDAASNVRLRGFVTDHELACLYRGALCVVAPAYCEDYGLTAVEAMHYGKPLIVCRDGGGLTAFVEDGVNGLVVDPTGPALANAIRTLADDPELALKMGAAARETAAQFTWTRAMAEIDMGIEIVMGAR